MILHAPVVRVEDLLGQSQGAAIMRCAAFQAAACPCVDSLDHVDVENMGGGLEVKKGEKFS